MKKYRIRKLSPLWWAQGIGLIVLGILALYAVTGAAVAIQ